MLQAHEAERGRVGLCLQNEEGSSITHLWVLPPSKRKMVESQTEVDNKDKDTMISRELKPLNSIFFSECKCESQRRNQGMQGFEVPAPR